MKSIRIYPIILAVISSTLLLGQTSHADTPPIDPPPSADYETMLEIELILLDFEINQLEEELADLIETEDRFPEGSAKYWRAAFDELRITKRLAELTKRRTWIVNELQRLRGQTQDEFMEQIYDDALDEMLHGP